MNPGENFVLKLWDASSGLILEYPISFDCWSNQNGAPMPNCGGIDEIYNFFYSSFFSVSLLVEPEGSGIVSGSGNYFENAIVTVTATANDGYTFVNWTEAGIEVSVEASYNFTITEDRILLANFEIIEDTDQTEIVLPFNYPNPVIKSTTIKYELDEPSHVNIKIVDLFGNEVRHIVHFSESAGIDSVAWNTLTNRGIPVSSGLYLYQIKSNSGNQTGKMVVIR